MTCCVLTVKAHPNLFTQNQNDESFFPPGSDD